MNFYVQFHYHLISYLIYNYFFIVNTNDIFFIFAILFQIFLNILQNLNLRNSFNHI